MRSTVKQTTMSQALRQILKHRDAKIGSPATVEEIAQVAAYYQRQLPESVVDFWLQCGGVRFDNTFDAKLLGPREVLQVLAESVWFDYAKFEVLPIFDSLQANYHVVCMNNLLAYRIMYTPHDDRPKLVYRDFDSFLADLYVGFNSAEWNTLYFHRQNNGDYARDKPRTSGDQATALKLLSLPDENHNWNFAIELLDESDPEPWLKLLQTNHFVRRDALTHLSAMTLPRMKAIYELDQREFATFFDQFEQAAHETGLPVGKRVRDSLNVGGRWINLDALFYLRNEPRALERMMNLCRDIVEKRNPRERPDCILGNDSE